MQIFMHCQLKPSNYAEDLSDDLLVEESYISDSVLVFLHTLIVSTGGNGKIFINLHLEFSRNLFIRF